MASAHTFRSVFLKILKILGLVMLVVLVLFGIASWIIFEKQNELLLDEIHAFVDKSQSGQLEIEALDLKLFKSFPNVTVELKGIKYYEHRDSLRPADEKPILAAEHFFVALDLMPLLNDQLKISRVIISTAQLDIIKYNNGKTNLQLALAPPIRGKPTTVPDTIAKAPTVQKPVTKPGAKPAVAAEPGSSIDVDLEFISFTNLAVTWDPGNKSHPTVVVINKLKADLVTIGNVLEADLTSTTRLQSVYIGNTSVPTGTLTFNSAIQYDIKNRQLTVRKTKILYDEFSALIEGTYLNKDTAKVDIEFDASSNDLELLSLVVKPEVLRQNPDLFKRGDIYIRGRVSGELKAPLVDVSFGMKDLALRLPRDLGTFNDVAFEGTFNSGSAPRYADAKLSIDRIAGELPGGFIKGKFSVFNFVEPYLKYNIDAQVKVDGYDQVFNIAAISQLKGLIAVRANFDGPLKLFDQHQSDSSRSSIITLDSLSFVLAKTNKRVSRLSGVLETRYANTTVKDFTFNYGRNNLSINATIDNFVYMLFKGSSNSVVSGSIKSSQLYTSDFIPDTTLVADVQDRISDLSIDFRLKTSPNDSADARIPNMEFTILNLTVLLDKLPDLNAINAKGTFRDTENGLKLDLTEFHATMPQGKLDVVGDLLIPAKKHLEFNARLQGDKFPVTYVEELITEIKTHNSGKLNKSVEQMPMVTTKLDLSAAITTRPFALSKLIIRDTKFDVLLPDKRTFSALKLNVVCNDLSFKYPGLKSTNGTVSVKQLQIPGLGPMDLALDITGKDDSLSIDFSRGVPDTKLEKGNLAVDFSNGKRSFYLNYVVKGAKLENYIQKFSKQELMKGEVDYEVDLTASGSTMDSLKHSIAGTIEINGDSLDIYGVNVDKILRKFERSQHFNLTDLGAVLMAGPVGLAITKGKDFVSLATIKLKPGDQTYLQELRTKWNLKNLTLTTEDVAFATRENRIALIGAIDFGNDSIPSLNIAVIDRNGCALMEQELYGKLTDLKTGKIKIARTLLGSVINFGNKVAGKDCIPVYMGTVKAPEEVEKGIKKLTPQIRKDSARRAP